MIAVLCDHFLVDSAGAVNTDAQSARWNSFCRTKIALDDFHIVDFPRIKVDPITKSRTLGDPVLKLVVATISSAAALCPAGTSKRIEQPLTPLENWIASFHQSHGRYCTRPLEGSEHDVVCASGPRSGDIRLALEGRAHWGQRA